MDEQKPMLFRHERSTGDYYGVLSSPQLTESGTMVRGGSAVRLSVSKYPQQSTYYYRSSNPHYVLADYQGERQVYRSPVSNYRQNPIPEGQLFGHHYEAPHHEVASLYTTEQGRSMAPGVLGVAALRAKQEGMELRPSDDLSPHSSQMVEHLKKKGLVPSSASHAITNDIDWTPADVTTKYPARERVSTEEWTQGRNYMRQMLRGNRAPAAPSAPAVQQLQFNL